MERNNTWFLVALSPPLFLFSLFLPLASVHDYCETRIVAAVIAVGASVLFFVLIHRRSTSMAERIASWFAEALCVLAVAAEVAFIAYATSLCR